ncbi:membrane protein insertion efficiency factor YidD [Aquabacterium commune]|uniref:membrane protein insertion efficiency factor YidD n=1 Tax=Aquabacterium commune TaxID=70586 RepID=UPI003C7A876C
MISNAAVFSIGLYQRYLSPYKGYCCAHRSLHGRESCSQYGSRSIRRAGLRRGLALLNRRFQACNAASLTLTEQRNNALKAEACPLWSQQGTKSCCAPTISACPF